MAPHRVLLDLVAGRAPTTVWHAGYPFFYDRAGTHLVVVNPRREAAVVPADGRLAGARPLLASGVTVDADGVRAGGFGYGVFSLPGSPGA